MINPNVRDLLAEITPYLSKFLERSLPKLSDDWWVQRVAPHLFDEQRNRLEKENLHTLDSLDLAALLKVFDQNWWDISTRIALPREVRNYLKEMRGIRNRWAHQTAAGFTFDDVLRDLDTLQRFAVSIEAGESFIQQIKAMKTSLIREQATKMKDAGPRPSRGIVEGPPVRENMHSVPPAQGEKPVKSPRRYDYTKYRFNGERCGKGRLVLAVVQEHVRKHPDISMIQLQVAFPDLLQGGFGVVRLFKQIHQNEGLHKRYFMTSEERAHIADGREEVVVCSQWGIGNIGRFLDRASILGYQIRHD